MTSVVVNFREGKETILSIPEFSQLLTIIHPSV